MSLRHSSVGIENVISIKFILFIKEFKYFICLPLSLYYKSYLRGKFI